MYPTEQTLKAIKNFDLMKKQDKILELIELIRENWKYADDGYFKLKGKKIKRLELHTAGFSDNEDIINALQKNDLFFMLFWEKSVRGGHYYFKIKPIKK